jgi:putative intracellular protease/amidase
MDIDNYEKGISPMYVLRRNEDGKYVAPSGSKNSYTSKLENARRYPSKEVAEADACGNETVVSI